jgi:hypothetical protein
LDQQRSTDRVREAVDRALRVVGPAEHGVERVSEQEDREEEALSS